VQIRNDHAVGNDYLLDSDLPGVAEISFLLRRNPCATDKFHRRKEP
jgi:hypothetical protein